MGLIARIAGRLRSDKQIAPPNATRAVVRRNSVISPLALSNQFVRIGGGLSPAAVSSIIQEADNGYIYRLVDLANEARQKDCHLQSLLGTRETALATLRWRLVPASDEEKDKEIASFVEAVLKAAKGRGGESRGFSDLITHMSGAVYFGFAVSETEWAKSGAFMVPVGFRHVSARRFRFTDDTGALAWWDSTSGQREGVELQKRYKDLFIQHQPRVNGDVPAREGLMRVLMWSALFRNWAMSDWMRLAELAWKPWRMGVYKDTASQEDIDDLIDAMDELSTNGVGVFSDRAQVNVEWPQRGRGGKPEHAELAEHLAHEMSKCVLGQTLTVESGERGARSLGEVHDRVRKDLREGDTLSQASTLDRDLIEPLVRLNFGDAAAVPHFEFITDDVADVGALARGVESLVRAGAKIPQWWVRDKFGAPDPKDGEDLCLGREVMQAQEGEYVSTSVMFEGLVAGLDPHETQEDDEPDEPDEEDEEIEDDDEDEEPGTDDE